MLKKFVTEIKTKLTENDLLISRNIYQPIVGIGPISLYQLLIDYHKMFKQSSVFHFFNDIAKTLGLSMNELEQYRMKLEAVGLIRTFERADNIHGIIVVNPPLCLEKFRKNSLLFKQAVKKVGEEIIERITFATNEPSFNKDDYKEVSVKYQDLFDITVEKQQTTLEIELPDYTNKDEAINALSHAQFAKYITSTRVSPTLLAIFQDLQKIGFSSKSLNLISDYSFAINGKIVANHVKTIADDLFSKSITGAAEVELELKNALKSKNSIETGTKQMTMSATETTEDAGNWDDIFNSLGDL